jgi:hypothetical protein
MYFSSGAVHVEQHGGGNEVVSDSMKASESHVSSLNFSAISGGT